ncbi:MAG: flagellar filament capping protein FliD [Defluviitaleaceae bacterium]|nr:flagellar filament capping protein FliD [Defluviitaleaceae bacterium]MCL2275275.1 flagellar filament capping protein FliD [Defluviitaleaceae bacterium]
MAINPIQQSMVSPTAHTMNNAPVRERHPHLSIEGVTQQPSAELEAARAFQTAVRGFGTAMRSAAAEILAGTQSLFDSLVGTSSDEEALTVAVNGYTNGYTNGNGRNGAAYVNGTGESNGANTNGVSANGNANGNGNGYAAAVNVYQLAAAQQNTGEALPANGAAQTQAGENNFTLERNGRSYDFSVNIQENASNRTVQQRVANEINDAQAGVRATIEANEEGQSALVLTAINTGENNAFTIADVPDEGNAIATLGADVVTREAQNALYTVNGEEYSAPTNTIDLSEGITATLQATAPDAITAATQQDVDGITAAITDMVDGFNEMRTAALEYAPQDNGADALRRRLDNIYYDNEFSLDAIGITRGEDQLLHVNDEQLTLAVEDGTAEAQLADPFGFTGQLERLGDAIVNDPTNYAMQLNMAVL